MTPIQDWAARWGLPPQALTELAGLPWATTVDPPSRPVTSEGALQSLVRLEAARKGIHLFRNNVGALLDKRGVPVRFGLANESKEENEVMKSSDLIGLEPVLIKPEHIGHIIGRLVSPEVKKPGWQYTGIGREPAQLRWISFINANGGRAMFVNREGIL